MLWFGKINNNKGWLNKTVILFTTEKKYAEFHAKNYRKIKLSN